MRSVHDGIHGRLSICRTIADQIGKREQDIAVMEISLPEICLVLCDLAHPYDLPRWLARIYMATIDA